MADISMCWADGCPLKENCYRYLAEADDLRQSYFQSVPYDEETKSCSHFWDAEKCPHCNLMRGNHKMDCDSRRIQVNIN